MLLLLCPQDALTKTIPIWAAVLNRAVARVRLHDQRKAQRKRSYSAADGTVLAPVADTQTEISVRPTPPATPEPLAPTAAQPQQNGNSSSSSTKPAVTGASHQQQQQQQAMSKSPPFASATCPCQALPPTSGLSINTATAAAAAHAHQQHASSVSPSVSPTKISSPTLFRSRSVQLSPQPSLHEWLDDEENYKGCRSPVRRAVHRISTCSSDGSFMFGVQSAPAAAAPIAEVLLLEEQAAMLVQQQQQLPQEVVVVEGGQWCYYEQHCQQQLQKLQQLQEQQHLSQAVLVNDPNPLALPSAAAGGAIVQQHPVAAAAAGAVAGEVVLMTLAAGHALSSISSSSSRPIADLDESWGPSTPRIGSSSNSNSCSDPPQGHQDLQGWSASSTGDGISEPKFDKQQQQQQEEEHLADMQKQSQQACLGRLSMSCWCGASPGARFDGAVGGATPEGAGSSCGVPWPPAAAAVAGLDTPCTFAFPSPEVLALQASSTSPDATASVDSGAYGGESIRLHFWIGKGFGRVVIAATNASGGVCCW